MSPIGGIIYVLEIFIAELVFLYACPRKKHFVLRSVLSIAVTLVIAYFFPLPTEYRFNQVYAFFRFFTLLMATFGVGCICFDLKADVIFALCMAAAGVQHIGHRLANLIAHFINMSNHIIIQKNWSYFELGVCIIVSVAAFFTFGRYVAKNGYFKNHDKRLNLVSILTIFICLVMTRFTRFENLSQSVIVNLYAILCCVLALVIQFSIYRMLLALTEKKTMEKLWEEERKQYQITKQTIEAINLKCHDMKHKLYNVETLPDQDETKELIRIYDNSLKTGNKVLNVVMMDYGLRYGKDNVEITFMGDGSALNFMEDADLYSLLGNSLSNAVEGVLKDPDIEKRTIAITVEQKGDFIAYHVTNHFNEKLQYSEGELLTTKENETQEHGYGMKSMAYIAKKYNGELKYSVQDDVFHLNVYLMQKN